MSYSFRGVTAYMCKGWCDRMGGVRSVRTISKSTKTRHLYKYPDGIRYCRRCEKYFVKEIVARMNKGIFCPCCKIRTSSRARRSVKESIVCQ